MALDELAPGRHDVECILWNQTGRSRGYRVQAPQAIDLLIGQDHAPSVGGNDHVPVLFVRKPLHTLNATNLPFDTVRHMPHIRADLFHPQEDVERIFPICHPPIEEICREVTAEQEDREATDRCALCRKVGDDVPTERRTRWVGRLTDHGNP